MNTPTHTSIHEAALGLINMALAAGVIVTIEHRRTPDAKPATFHVDTRDTREVYDRKPPACGVLAGEPEILGERCADGGTCHHGCAASCFRRIGCVPLGASGLSDSWGNPADEVPVQIRVDKEVAELHRRIGDAGIVRILRAGITRRQLRPGSLGPWTEDQRQAVGEALTNKLAEMCEGGGAPDWFDARNVDVVLDTAEAQFLVEAPDDGFRGDTPHLITCMRALVSLDEEGAITSSIGGHARTLLLAAASRLERAAGAKGNGNG